jgi:hypothetical protein
MKIKELAQEEYDHLVQEHNSKEWIVSPLDFILMTYQLVAVEYPNEMYKILKYPFIKEQEEKLEVLITKEELQEFIFLNCI